jgi:hypothetical protein
MVASLNIMITGGNRGKKLSISSYNICIMEFVSNMTKAQKERYVRENFTNRIRKSEKLPNEHIWGFVI